jgi:hypothetical protein
MSRQGPALPPPPGPGSSASARTRLDRPAGDQLFGRAVDDHRLSARTRLGGSRNAVGVMLTAVEWLLSNIYTISISISIILDRTRRGRVQRQYLRSILRSNWPPRSNPPQFRHRFPVRARCAWYMPPKSKDIESRIQTKFGEIRRISRKSKKIQSQRNRPQSYYLNNAVV